MERHDALDMVRTRFTKGEVRRAEVLELMTDWHHGYPQPEREMAYRSLTYDDSDYCQDCGGGLRPVAPFRMPREPRWGRRAILQLNWVFDEFFVRPEFPAEVFAPPRGRRTSGAGQARRACARDCGPARCPARGPGGHDRPRR